MPAQCSTAARWRIRNSPGRMALLLQRVPIRDGASPVAGSAARQEFPELSQVVLSDQFGKAIRPADTDIQAVTDWLPREVSRELK